MSHSSRRTAVVLAGGASSRFGSNKALQVLAGKALICRVTEHLSHVTNDILIIIGRNESKGEYEAALPSYARVMNDEREGKNPLIGIVTGLRAAESEYTLVSACDVPFIRENVIELLFERASGVDAAIPRWNGGHIEPLEAVYRTAPTLQAALDTLVPPDQPLRRMLARLGRVRYVSVENEIRRIDPDLRTFFNVNTREEMDRGEKMLLSWSVKRANSGIWA